jgi:UDP-2,3-diacylglucosamine hydrolase
MPPAPASVSSVLVVPGMGTCRVRLAAEDRALFVSDTHLGEHDPLTAAFFLQALQRRLRLGGPEHKLSHLFLLGDLFELWVGDDDQDYPLASQLAAILAAASSSGLTVFVMRGNRDFLLGSPKPDTPSWPSLAHASLLDDPCCIELFGQLTVLTHGDLLCTDDLDYQAFRTTVREPHWQATVLDRPLNERRELARNIRAKSESGKGAKPGAWMDAKEDAMIAMLRQFGARRMIHGHTHKPGRHEHLVTGADPSETEVFERLVLPDWQAGQRGYFVIADANGLRQESIEAASPG